MQVLPVLDVLKGQVVRGIGGRREEYRPIVSQLTPVAEPLAVARAFREHFGLVELYVADLDAIAGQPPALGVVAALLEDGFELWVDAGLRATEALAGLGVQSLVAGLESLPGPASLYDLLQRWSPARIVFSLDLKEGRPLGQAGWEVPEAWGIAEQAVRLGCTRLLVLDLAGVGVNQGTRTDALCKGLRATYPHLEITTGGGVRDRADLGRLQGLGVTRVLVASALHDGRLARGDVLCPGS